MLRKLYGVWQRRPRRWASHGPRELLTAAEALAWLTIARSVLLVVPFRGIHRWLGSPGVEVELSPDQPRVARLAWAVRVVSACMPFQCSCFVQSLAIKAMLRRRGIASTLYLGVLIEENALQAHAWVRAQRAVLTGQPDVAKYRVLAVFTEPWARHREHPC